MEGTPKRLLALNGRSKRGAAIKHRATDWNDGGTPTSSRQGHRLVAGVLSQLSRKTQTHTTMQLNAPVMGPQGWQPGYGADESTGEIELPNSEVSAVVAERHGRGGNAVRSDYPGRACRGDSDRYTPRLPPKWGSCAQATLHVPSRPSRAYPV